MFDVIINFGYISKRKIVKRNTLNFWIDLFTFIVLFAKIWTGLLVHYVLPPGQGRGHSLELWGLNRHEYGAIHFYLAIAMIVLVIFHVWLHWSWICKTLSSLLKIKKLNPSRYLLYAIISLLIAIFLTIASLQLAKTQVINIQESSKAYSTKSETEQLHNQVIIGRTTLIEAAKIGDMPIEKLIDKLNLPNNVDPQEQLGRLKRKYGFEIQDVRKIVLQD